MDQLDLIDMYRVFHPQTMNFTFFLSAHGTFSRIGHILGHKSNLGKFFKFEIISRVFSNHNGVRLDVSYMKNAIKNTNIQSLMNTLLNGKQITEEIKKKIKIRIEKKMKLKARQPKPMGFSKSSAQREVHSNTSLPQETRETSNKQPKFTPKATQKRTEKLQSQQKEIIKIRAKINEKEIKETVIKINKTKSWFFEKIKLKNHQPDSSSKRGRRITSTKLEMKKERDYSRQHRNTKDHKRPL